MYPSNMETELEMQTRKKLKSSETQQPQCCPTMAQEIKGFEGLFPEHCENSNE